MTPRAAPATRLGNRLSEARLALMMLSRLPAGRLAEPAPGLAQALWAFPLVGLVVGALAAIAGWGAMAMGLPPLMAAGLALGVQILVTGALHEDGLADLCDGFWGGWDRARRLQIMRDSAIGSYGVLGLIVVVGLRWQGLAVLGTHGAWGALIAVGAVSRLAPVILMAALPPARAEGMGHRARAPFGPRSAVALALGAAALLTLPGWPLALALGLGAVLVTAIVARAKIGGQTGDVLGASQQLTELALICALCVTLG